MFLIQLYILSTTVFACSYGVVLADSPCPEGSVQGPNNPNVCYKVIADKKDWYTADSTCQTYKGHLASVHDGFTNTFFVGMAGGTGSSDFWIGGNNNNVNSTWGWIDGTPFDYNEWAPGLPYPNPSFCLSARVPSGFWYSSDCRELKPFICNVGPAHLAAPSCPTGWNYFDGAKACYKVVNGTTDNPMSCDHGNDLCLKMNSTLASIHSWQENSFIVGLTLTYISGTYYNYVATGLISDGISWQWRDNSLLDYTNWGSTLTPRNHYCAVLNSNYYGPQYFTQWDGNWNRTQQSQYFNQAVCKLSAYRN